MLIDELNNIIDKYLYKIASKDNIKGLEYELTEYIYSKYGVYIDVKVSFINSNITVNFDQNLNLLDRRLKIEKILRNIK